MVDAKKNGRRIEVADAWISATARWLNVPLVTHNPSDYSGSSGLQLVSER
jgi:predicted nucleic acid-binding protein